MFRLLPQTRITTPHKAVRFLVLLGLGIVNDGNLGPAPFFRVSRGIELEWNKFLLQATFDSEVLPIPGSGYTGAVGAGLRVGRGFW